MIPSSLSLCLMLPPITIFLLHLICYIPALLLTVVNRLLVYIDVNRFNGDEGSSLKRAGSGIQGVVVKKDSPEDHKDLADAHHLEQKYGAHSEAIMITDELDSDFVGEFSLQKTKYRKNERQDADSRTLHRSTGHSHSFGNRHLPAALSCFQMQGNPLGFLEEIHHARRRCSQSLGDCKL